MNLLLIILSGLAGLIVLLLIIAAFSRKDYNVTSEITIQKPSHLVFDYVKLLKNQDNFSKWAMMDPDMHKEFRGTDGTVGFVSAWDSDKKNVGKGEQEITAIKEGVQIDYEVRFIKPFAGVAKVYLSIDSLNEHVTLVNWEFSSKMPYPMNLMLLFMNMEKQIADDLNTGLRNLKTLLE